MTKTDKVKLREWDKVLIAKASDFDAEFIAGTFDTDIERLATAITRVRGEPCTPTEAFVFWYSYSKSMYAGWMTLPIPDEELDDQLKRMLPSLDLRDNTVGG